MMKKYSVGLVALIICIVALWYGLFALKNKPMDEGDILARYHYQPIRDWQPDFNQVQPNTYRFTFVGFDGDTVYGQIQYPDDYTPDNGKQYPVVIGMHAMGRGYLRWWTDSFKRRPTVTHVNKITEVAVAKGNIVIALDAREHSNRKNPYYLLPELMRDLHLWGKKEPYEAMIVDSIVDYRFLLDWIEQHPQIDQEKITTVGYSMGGQMSLLLAAIDARVDAVAAIVPPYLDDKTAVVAPKNLVHRIINKPVLFISAEDDEYASHSENLLVVNAIGAEAVTHKTYPGGHILPVGYIDELFKWL